MGLDLRHGIGHYMGGDDEIQKQTAVANDHQRLYFTQRGPRRIGGIGYVGRGEGVRSLGNHDNLDLKVNNGRSCAMKSH